MGASLRTSKNSTPENAKNSTTSRSSIIELIKPECLKRQKKRHINPELQQPENSKKLTKVMKKLTLEEWILSSPGIKPEGINGGELYILKNFSKKVHPSSSSGSVPSALSSRPRESLERLVKTDNEGDGQDSVVSSMSIISQSGRQKKKVSFRMPEEADIIIFHSPEEN